MSVTIDESPAAKTRAAKPVRGEVPAQLVEAARLVPDAVVRMVGSANAGLSEAEARKRRKTFGPNTVAGEARKSIAMQVVLRARNPLNLLLLLLASISLLTGDLEAAAIIFVMVVLSVSLGFLQELRSNHAAEKLRSMVHTTATVLRKGAARREPRTKSSSVHGVVPPGSYLAEIPVHALVPGDIVHLSAGDMVPADLRVLAAKELFINQAALTGESLPVEKFPDGTADSRDALQLPNVCFMGTNVVSGSATAVVVLTGSRAYFGTVAGVIAQARSVTSFERGVSRFTWLMIRFIVVMAPLVFLINGLTKHDWSEAFLFAVAVAVGLTPEMLPMIVTVNLAKGAIAMSRKRVIVKRLNAIQNFGAMDILCTDKTGTLTQDRVIVKKHVDLAGNDSSKVLEYAYLNSFYQSGLKNLLDQAVLHDPDSTPYERVARAHRPVDEIPFDFTRRRMSVVLDNGGQRLLICKGAVEEVVAACSEGEVRGHRFPLDAGHSQRLKRVSEELNRDGFRLIAIAYKHVPTGQRSFGREDERHLVLLGYIAFLDPPKETAAAAIHALEGKGVRVKIITGDNAIVTRKICADVGLDPGEVVLGSDLESLSDARLSEVAERAHVFAKVTPTDKSRIIEALQRNGHVVGFMGDGINDGPALKVADVGVSVDSAVDIAKESADIILLEKSLLVLGDGVTEGRKVFGNIIKYIRMGASSNFGNMFSVIGASAWLPFLPMAPIQVLTNNLLYDVSQTAIPTDNVDEEYLSRPRRWEIGNIGRFVLLIGPISSIFDYTTYLMMYFVFDASTVGKASLFQTGWFVESLISQTLIIHVVRTRRIPFLQSRASTALIATSVAICAVGAWLPYSSLARALGFSPLPTLYWPLLAATLATYLLLTYLMKQAFHRWFGVD